MEHLRKRGNSYSVRVKVPARLRQTEDERRLRPAHLERALGTSDLREANKRKHAVVAEFKRLIADWEHAQQDPRAARVLEAVKVRTDILRLKGRQWVDEQGERPIAFSELVLDEARLRAKEIEEEAGPEEAERFLQAIRGTATFIADLVDLWQAEDRQHCTGQTRVQDRAAVDALLDWAGRDATVEEFNDRARAGAYVSHMLADSAHSRRTVQRHLSHLAALWRWLAARGTASRDNPWRGHGLGAKSKRGGPEETPRRQWTDAELVKLMTGQQDTRYLSTFHDLVKLAITTGARAEELCALRCRDVVEREDGWWIAITEGKTSAAVREIPVPACAAPVLRRRLADRDEFLFKGLIPGGPDAKRSWFVTKAFRSYRRHIGLKDSATVFHSLRNTYAEAMEAAEVPVPTIQKLMGHVRGRGMGETATYSKGERLRLREYVDRLTYSDEVVRLISQEGTPCTQSGDYSTTA